jgi:tetratricopeptide (TPR) repeat protein
VESAPDFEYFQLQIHEPVFRLERGGGPIPDRYRTSRPRVQDQSFPARKARGTVRVFIVGGSVAMPFADAGNSRLEDYLSRALPGRKVEIVYCGMAGYDSYRDGLVEREILGYDPDLIVLLSGNNEAASPLRISPGLFRLNLLLRRSRLFQTLQDGVGRGRPSDGPTPLEQGLARFDANLRAMIAAARSRGVAVVACTLPQDIRDLPPDAAPLAEEGYLRARVELDRGEAGKAVAGLKTFLAAHPREPAALFWLGRALERSGSPVEARRAYLDAAERTDPPEGCARRCNEIIRSAGGADRAAVADLDAAFSRLVPDGLTDARVFKDRVHWRDEYYPYASLEIVKTVADYDRTHAAPMLAPAAQWNRWWESGAPAVTARPKPASARREAYAEQALMSGVASAVNDGPVAREFDERGVAYFQMAEALSPGILRRRLSAPAWAEGQIDRSPWLSNLRGKAARAWARVELHAGEACRRRGDLAPARAFLDEAVRGSPDEPYARLFRGLLERSLGREREAADDLHRAERATASAAANWAKAAL